MGEYLDPLRNQEPDTNRIFCTGDTGDAGHQQSSIKEDLDSFNAFMAAGNTYKGGEEGLPTKETSGRDQTGERDQKRAGAEEEGGDDNYGYSLAPKEPTDERGFTSFSEQKDPKIDPYHEAYSKSLMLADQLNLKA